MSYQIETSPNIRRRIIPINRKQETSNEHINPYIDQIENQLRSNVTLFRKSFSFVPINKYLPNPKVMAQKHTLIPNKKDIDYFSLFQRKLSTIKKPKEKIVTSIKLHKQHRKSQQLQVKVIPSVKKTNKYKIPSFQQKKIDICQQTIKMLRGLDDKDVNAFILLLEHAQGKRKRTSIERWKTFDIGSINIGQEHTN